MLVAKTGQCFWRFDLLPGQCSWLFTLKGVVSQFSGRFSFFSLTKGADYPPELPYHVTLLPGYE
jgi:hypothetical protein